MLLRLTVALCGLLLQLPPAEQPLKTTQGRDPEAQLDYMLISLEGRLLGASAAPAQPPRLTGRCTRDKSGHDHFELMADAGGLPPPGYVAPWKPAPGELFPPRLERRTVVMDFLGYTTVKPVKRQWLVLQEPAGELEYNTPGLGSANMEPIGFYMQYLKALPSLRLSFPDGSRVEFRTTAWQAALHAAPLCRASGL